MVAGYQEFDHGRPERTDGAVGDHHKLAIQFLRHSGHRGSNRIGEFLSVAIPSRSTKWHPIDEDESRTQAVAQIRNRASAGRNRDHIGRGLAFADGDPYPYSPWQGADSRHLGGFRMR